MSKSFVIARKGSNGEVTETSHFLGRRARPAQDGDLATFRMTPEELAARAAARARMNRVASKGTLDSVPQPVHALFAAITSSCR